jgi:hypothetical protein
LLLSAGRAHTIRIRSNIRKSFPEFYYFYRFIHYNSTLTLFA